MSRIAVRTKLRKGWSYLYLLRANSQTFSDDQFEEYLDRGLDIFNENRRNEGQTATLQITAGSKDVPLPLDFIATAANKEALRRVEEQLDPLARSVGVPQLNYPGYASRSSYRSQSPELDFNLSRPLQPPAPKMRNPNIKQKKIDGVNRPVLVLYSPAQSSRTVDIVYQGKHQVENASAVLTVVTNPAADETLTVESATIAETIYTFTSGSPASGKIVIGGSQTLTATNIKTALAALGLSVTQVGAALTIVAADGEDFTITVDGVKIANVFTESINTILEKQAEFYQILESFILNGLTSNQLGRGVSIKDCRDEAARLLSQALSRLAPRVVA